MLDTRFAKSRIEGWDTRLMALIEGARETPFQFGVHDCFRFTCRAIEATTGRDRWPEFRGYRTRREALAKLAQFGGTDFLSAGDLFFGVPHTNWKHAHRGDIACGDERRKGNSVWHPLGVVLGLDVAFLSRQIGLVFVPVNESTCVWPVN